MSVVFFAFTVGLVKLQDLIRTRTAKPIEVLLRQVTPDTYKEVLKEVKAKEYYNLVIDTNPDNMNFFLKGVSLINPCAMCSPHANKVTSYRYRARYSSPDAVRPFRNL